MKASPRTASSHGNLSRSSGLADRQVRELINHNEDVNSLYLFLRTDSGRPYTYLGRLKYLSHDTQREQPVYFKWQILEWDVPPVIPAHIGLTLLPSVGVPPPVPAALPRHVLAEASPPPQRATGRGTW
jgi:hypothetical protein